MWSSLGVCGPPSVHLCTQAFPVETALAAFCWACLCYSQHPRELRSPVKHRPVFVLHFLGGAGSTHPAQVNPPNKGRAQGWLLVEQAVCGNLPVMGVIWEGPQLLSCSWLLTVTPPEGKKTAVQPLKETSYSKDWQPTMYSMKAPALGL